MPGRAIFTVLFLTAGLVAVTYPVRTTSAETIPLKAGNAPGAVLDQNNPAAALDGSVDSWSAAAQAETFTAGVTGQLTDVVIWVQNVEGAGQSLGDGPFTLALEAAGGPPPDGSPDPYNVLASVDFSLAPSSSFAPVDVAFPQSVYVRAGTQYGLVLTAPPGSICDATGCSGIRWEFASQSYSGGSWAIGAGLISTSLAFQTWVVLGAAPPDTTPPTAPTDMQGTLVSGGLALDWTDSIDNVGVDHYVIYANGSELDTVGGDSPTDFIDAPLPRRRTAYVVRAVDAAGNMSDPSTPIVLDPLPRPHNVPKTLPSWALALYAWQQTGSAGAQPRSPKPLPRWYASWTEWRLNPVRLLG